MTRCSLRRCGWIGAAMAAPVLLAGCFLVEEKVDYTRVLLDARAALLQAAEDPDPQVRTKALEVLAEAEGAPAGPVMLQSLGDENEPVRFAAAMAIGDVGHAPAKALLRALAADDETSPKLRCAVIYALHRLGDDTHTTELGRLLHHEDKWVRATAAMVMGRLGEESAIGPLENLRRDERDPVVRLQVTEALAALGERQAMAHLQGFTRSQFIEDQIIAVQGLGRADNPGSRYCLKRLLYDQEEDPAVRVAAAGSLARLGETLGRSLAVQAAENPERLLRQVRGRQASIRPAETSNLQTLAALALGQMKDVKLVRTLHPLVFSRDGAVRVGAAASVIVLLRDYQPEVTGRVQPKEMEPFAPLPEIPPKERIRPTTRPTTRPIRPASGPATGPVRPTATQPVKPAAVPATQPVRPVRPTATRPAPREVPPKTTTAPETLPVRTAPAGEAPTTRPAGAGFRTSGGRD